MDPKILYIGTPYTGLDYLSDSVFHGMRSLLGELVVDAIKINYMYNSFPKEDLANVYGKGFTLGAKLPDILIDRSDIEHKIKSKYFNFIMIGAPYRSNGMDQLIKLACNYYDPSKIIVFNGNDSHQGQQTPPNINAIHFLRERFTDDFTIPISFSIPKEIIVNEIVKKDIELMPMIPGRRETYTYNTEEEYYSAYRHSMFGLTWKKGGWDCLRHYEILSQGCIPLFLDIMHLPKTMMINFPRNHIEYILDSAVKIEGYNKHMEFQYNSQLNIENLNFLNMKFVDPNSYGYYDIANKLLEHTKQYLTTEYAAKYVLNVINNKHI